MSRAQRLHEQATYAVTPALIVLFGAAKPAGTSTTPGDTVPLITPDASKAPGATGIRDAINGFAFYALCAAAAGFLLGLAVWAVGSRAGNDYAATGGKVGAAVAVGVAFLVGAATPILRFSFGAGGT